jgi:hypothetical protein
MEFPGYLRYPWESMAWSLHVVRRKSGILTHYRFLRSHVPLNAMGVAGKIYGIGET